MSKRWVSNTSPLIFLNKTGQLKLLTDLCEELVVPKAVADELLSYKDEQIVWTHFFASPKVKALKASFTVHQDIAGWDLGKGESEVISYAVTHPGYEVILDDLEARKCADTYNIPLRGTVGIILSAKLNKLIPEAKPVIEVLIASGFRFNAAWIKAALALVGEDIEIK